MKGLILRNEKTSWIVFTIFLVTIAATIFLFEKGEVLGRAIAS